MTIGTHPHRQDADKCTYMRVAAMSQPNHITYNTRWEMDPERATQGMCTDGTTLTCFVSNGSRSQSPLNRQISQLYTNFSSYWIYIPYSSRSHEAVCQNATLLEHVQTLTHGTQLLSPNSLPVYSKLGSHSFSKPDLDAIADHKQYMYPSSNLMVGIGSIPSRMPNPIAEETFEGNLNDARAAGQSRFVFAISSTVISQGTSIVQVIRTLRSYSLAAPDMLPPPVGHGFNLSLFIRFMMITRACGSLKDDNDLIEALTSNIISRYKTPEGARLSLFASRDQSAQERFRKKVLKAYDAVN
ncbi:hypothetical protein M431DRAFT_482591 [Trichoderma harzianum CBS 226.95]|uniref:Uncharacterized protein n=1 Tax=Trichoderma harzianum CBS 226.95 TaxID=983964 RepID=A0A2T4A9Y6_TRIHA|nr:hypothetical protein M431DRAFT_482591 [Trichoderma harzianum CBS 226.95]PTB53728.1 hypothetical protein M431DRAFT_482591 [Trichoderma harzianum CBS 226.95]